ncbi:MAG: fibronectin type III domain-containing protein [Oscillospiraceae bacterium]|nr:fibronectin type III domain-containing protein [Oscillospiraceae bacterium]
MKKILAVILAAIFMVAAFPLSADAEGLKAPVVQYKILNHDKVSLKWSKVEGAESYCIYKRDDKTGKYIKKYEVKSNAVTLKNLSPDTEYSYAVAAVKDGVKSKFSNKVTFTTPVEWYYFSERYNTGDGFRYRGYREHYDGSGREENEMGINISYGNKRIYCDGWIYYIDVNDEEMRYAYDYFSNMLYKVKNDGTENKWLYSLGGRDVEKIYVSDNAVFLLLHDGTDYYDDINDYDGWSVYGCSLYKISLDGKEHNEMYSMTDPQNFHITNYIVDFTVTSDGIYYVEYSEKEGAFTDKGILDKSDYCYKLYKINSDGTDVKFIAKLDDYGTQGSLSENSLYFLNDCIYYTTDIDGFCGLKRLSLDTNETKEIFYCDTKMLDAHSKFITEFINGYFYIDARNFNYDIHDYEYKYYRFKADGTGLTEQEKPFEWRY